MTEESTPSAATFRAAIEHLLQERLDGKVGKFAKDIETTKIQESSARGKRAVLTACQT